MFQMSLDNPSMMEIYPYGGILAYMKYHYLDGVMKQNLMLMDKTRYVHDKGEKKVAVARRPKSESETNSIVSMFGIGSQAEQEIEKVRKEIGD